MRARRIALIVALTILVAASLGVAAALSARGERPFRSVDAVAVAFAIGFLDDIAALGEPSASPFLPPGHGGTPPGQGGIPPGQTTPPGQGGTPPGQDGQPPPGHRR